jgi:hypothetical protein
VLATEDIVVGPYATTVHPATLGLHFTHYVFDTLSDQVFFDLFVRKTMNSDPLLDEAYGPTELDKMIENEFFNLSNSDKKVDMIMLMSRQEKMDRRVEHILNFKGSIKRKRVINRDGVSGARLLFKDYFASDPPFPDDPWFHCRFLCANHCFCALWREWCICGPKMKTKELIFELCT